MLSKLKSIFLFLQLGLQKNKTKQQKPTVL